VDHWGGRADVLSALRARALGGLGLLGRHTNSRRDPPRGGRFLQRCFYSICSPSARSGSYCLRCDAGDGFARQPDSVSATGVFIGALSTLAGACLATDEREPDPTPHCEFARWRRTVTTSARRRSSLPVAGIAKVQIGELGKHGFTRPLRGRPNQFRCHGNQARAVPST